VERVIDGDTLELTNGERVRLIGIDAPEVGHHGTPDKPFARAAKDELSRVVAESAWKVRIVPGKETRDRHGRALAHLYDRRRDNVSEHLLHLGLAYQVTIPPNDRFRDCYLKAEDDARRQGRGLWNLAAVDAAVLPPETKGFERVEGRVRGVRRGRGGVWIELKGPLKLHVSAGDLSRFASWDLSALDGAHVEVLGWIYRYRGETVMRVRDPSAFRSLEPDARRVHRCPSSPGRQPPC
jgi:endonuclease YncB( thermonuclease family)